MKSNNGYEKLRRNFSSAEATAAVIHLSSIGPVWKGVEAEHEVAVTVEGRMVVTMQRRLRMAPTPSMSLMASPPAVYTMALGGVETGNMKEWLAVRVTPRLK